MSKEEDKSKKLTIDELEQKLNTEAAANVQIKPDGAIIEKPAPDEPKTVEVFKGTAVGPTTFKSALPTVPPGTGHIPTEPQAQQSIDPGKVPPKPEPPPQKPSLGRVVLFHVSGVGHEPKKFLPAMVVAVHGDTCVNLRILLDGERIRRDVPEHWSQQFSAREFLAGTAFRSSVSLGDEPGQWTWPPRV